MRVLCVLATLLCTSNFATAATLSERIWKVDGAERRALVHLPDATEPAPLVFAFHGHGGTSERAAKMFRVHELWPEAVVVYPQGVPTPGRLSDPEGKKNGWQKAAGDHGDRDLAFFDAMFKSLVDEKRIDAKRVYITGHSNGGAYTYLLWAERGERITAVAPSGALDARSAKKLKPKPVLHVAGKGDPLVKFQWQQKMIDAVLDVNQCDRQAGKRDGDVMTTYPSKLDTSVITYLYNGGHRFPAAAAAEIVTFFKSQTGTAAAQP
jgi:polyhydroxybutyrate depolymerase